ncbi:hypothetical protein BDN72DRAFT_849558 [Pluteus cervinus]|uniref:Uncharacterized protein n=1 Tax=Pluteus cervinus TaxID=181527 RepID=A0ACD3A7N3_9AGAR|nr:hypothetical protein BDN72DRAFT_849558 [Pluteus cervinus]
MPPNQLRIRRQPHIHTIRTALSTTRFWIFGMILGVCIRTSSPYLSSWVMITTDVSGDLGSMGPYMGFVLCLGRTRELGVHLVVGVPLVRVLDQREFCWWRWRWDGFVGGLTLTSLRAG